MPVDDRIAAHAATFNAAVRSEEDVDVATVRWGSGGTGAMRLRWDADMVRELEISFD